MTDTKDKRIRTAFTTYSEEGKKWGEENGYQSDERQWWVSDDGERWLPVNQPPTTETTVQEVTELFDPPTGNFTPINYGRAYLSYLMSGQHADIYIGGEFMPDGWRASVTVKAGA